MSFVKYTAMIIAAAVLAGTSWAEQDMSINPPYPSIAIPPPMPSPPLPNIRGLCPNAQQVANQSAKAFERLSGENKIPVFTVIEIRVEFIITTEGKVKNARVIRSSNPIFNDLAIATASRFSCNGREADITIPYDIVFRLTP